MLKKSIKIQDVLKYALYSFFSIFFILVLMTSNDVQNLHFISGYLMSGVLIAGTLFVFFRQYQLVLTRILNIRYYIAQSVLLITEQILSRQLFSIILRGSILFSLFMSVFTGMLVLAFDDRLGPLAEIIIYFPYWVFVFAEDLHEIFSIASVFFVSSYLISLLFDRLVVNERILQVFMTDRKSR